MSSGDDHHGILAALALVDADGIGGGDVAEIAALEDVPLAIEVGGERALLGVDGDDRADVAVEEALVVVVAELDEFVAGAELARGGAQTAGACGLSAAWSCWLRLATPATPLCMGASTCTSLIGCEPAVMPRDELGAEREHLLQAVLGRVGGDEVEVAPRLHGREVVRHGRGPRIAGVDGVGGGDDEALALLAVDDREARDGRSAGAAERSRSPAAMRSLSTLPAPTEGSWSMSPTSSRCARDGTAAKSAAARRVSSIEVSSTMRKSVASGLDSLTVKPPLAASNFNRRWMVEANPPVVSVSRWAARPVGAARCTRTCLAFRMSTRARRIEVLPVPGPPVRMLSLCVERVAHGGGLQFVKRKAGAFLRPGQGGLHLDRRQARRHAREPRHDGGDLLLGVIVDGQLEEGGAGQGSWPRRRRGTMRGPAASTPPARRSARRRVRRWSEEFAA